MNLPFEISLLIEKLSENYSLPKLKDSAVNISASYQSEKSSGERIASSPIEVMSYALSRMPATFGSVSSALEHSLPLLVDPIYSLLDIGGGTGSSSLAASLLISSLKEITVIEREEEMIKLSKEILRFQNVNYIQQDATLKFDNKADLVCESYFLNELKEDQIFKEIDNIYDASNKYLLLVEPGTPKSYERMMKIRTYLINKGAYLVGPCSHMGDCPLKNDWCNFVTRVNRTKIHKQLKEGSSPYEDEKFFYLFFAKTPQKPNKNRIIRHPIINSGFIDLKLCTKNEDIEVMRISKSQKDEYKKAKKSQVGDEI